MSMKSKAMLVVLLMSSIAMVPTSGCLGSDKITVEYEVDCHASSYMSAQLNGEEKWAIDYKCQDGHHIYGRGDITAEAGDVFQIVYLQQNAYACEVVISKYHINEGYALCEN